MRLKYMRDEPTSNSSETTNFRTKVSWKLPETWICLEGSIFNSQVNTELSTG